VETGKGEGRVSAEQFAREIIGCCIEHRVTEVTSRRVMVRITLRYGRKVPCLACRSRFAKYVAKLKESV